MRSQGRLLTGSSSVGLARPGCPRQRMAPPSLPLALPAQRATLSQQKGPPPPPTALSGSLGPPCQVGMVNSGSAEGDPPPSPPPSPGWRGRAGCSPASRLLLLLPPRRPGLATESLEAAEAVRAPGRDSWGRRGGAEQGRDLLGGVAASGPSRPVPHLAPAAEPAPSASKPQAEARTPSSPRPPQKERRLSAGGSAPSPEAARKEQKTLWGALKVRKIKVQR